MRVDLRFVEIGEIVDPCCLNFRSKDNTTPVAIQFKKNNNIFFLFLP